MNYDEPPPFIFYKEVRILAMYLRSKNCLIDYDIEEDNQGNPVAVNIFCDILDAKEVCPKPKNKGSFDENCLVSDRRLMRD